MYFEKMGIYGMNEIEDAVLAALVTGDPLLFIGAHGTAKTTLARKIAEAMGLKFHAYDASKGLFEDIIGFPNPDSISSGQIDYVSTPLSIWDKEFILVDEISRARAEMQNKWLEIIRGRQVMGKNAEKLKYVFSAMNPPSYAGANPLDEALAGRFAFIINVPQASQMGREDVRKIMNNVTKDDAVVMNNAKETSMNEKETLGFVAFLKESIKFTKQVETKLGAELENYIILFKEIATSKNLLIDGRRLGMMKRNLVAYLSVVILKNAIEEYTFQSLEPHIKAAVNYSMPFEAFDSEGAGKRVKYIANMAYDMSFNEQTRNIVSLNTEENVEALTQEVVNGNYAFLKNAMTRLCEIVKSKSDIEKKPRAFAAIKALAKKITSGELVLHSEDTERMLELYRGLYDMSGRRNYRYSALHFCITMVHDLVIDDSVADLTMFKPVFNALRNEEEDQVSKDKVKEVLKNMKDFNLGRK